MSFCTDTSALKKKKKNPSPVQSGCIVACCHLLLNKENNTWFIPCLVVYADAQSHGRWHVSNCPCQFLILYICCQVKSLKSSRQGSIRIHFLTLSNLATHHTSSYHLPSTKKNEQVLKQESSNDASQSSLFCLWLCLLILVQWHFTVHHSYRAHTCTQCPKELQ